MPPLAADLRPCLPSDPSPSSLPNRVSVLLRRTILWNTPGSRKRIPEPPHPPPSRAFTQPLAATIRCCCSARSSTACIGGMTQPPPLCGVNSIGAEARLCVDRQKVATCEKTSAVHSCKAAPLARHRWRNFGCNAAATLPCRGGSRTMELLNQPIRIADRKQNPVLSRRKTPELLDLSDPLRFKRAITPCPSCHIAEPAPFPA